MRQTIPFLLLLLLFPLSMLTGSVDIGVNEVWQALVGKTSADSLAYFIVIESRLPQALTAILAGAALAAGGLVMQTLFANPLADPSLLGVNSGASLGAALALLGLGSTVSVGSSVISGVVLTIIASFLGACGVIVLLIFCSTWLRGNLALLVTGVMLSFAISAIISLLSFCATDEGVHSFVIWGLGDFSGVSLERLPLMAFLIIGVLSLLMLLSKELNALLLGEDYATNLGVKVKRVRTSILLLTSLLTAVVTSLCGPISFIGLAVPHIARMLMHTANHKILLPITIVLGADVALFSLLISHLPGERGTLPLGAITPLIGVPVVITILLRRH